MLHSLLAWIAGLDFIKPIFRSALVQKICRFFLGGIQFTAKVPVYGFTFISDVFNVRVHTEIQKEGAYEAKMSALLASKLIPGMILLDVGANIGYYSLLASKKVGEQGSVIAVEPDPACILLLKKNILLNQLLNIQIVEKGLSDAEKDVQLFSTLVTGFNSFTKENVPNASSGIPVHVTTVDRVANGKKIDVLKMDIQGAELACLRGAEEMLKNPRISLFIEFWPYGLRNAGEDPIELFRFLFARGFTVQTIEFPFDLRDEMSAKRLTDHVEAMEKGYPYQGYVNLFASRL